MARYSTGAVRRSSGDKLTSREDMARLSRSRAVPETITPLAARFASMSSDTGPSWRAPMVGTSAVVAVFALRRSRARRNAGTVRTIMGLRDIWARSDLRETAELAVGRRPYQGRCLAAKPAGDSSIQTAIELPATPGE